MERSLNPYAANNDGSLCCKDRYKNCKSIVANFTKELEFIEGIQFSTLLTIIYILTYNHVFLFIERILFEYSEEVLEEHLEEQFQCSELDEGSEHQLEISEDRVVRIKVAFRLFTKVLQLNRYRIIKGIYLKLRRRRRKYS